MGANTVEATGAKGRRDALAFDPEDIRLIGLDPQPKGDTSDPTKDPLYDPTVTRPPLESFVLNIQELGVLEPVIVENRGKLADGTADIVCVDGRDRIKGARAANERLKRAGLAPILVYAVLRKHKTDRDAVAAMDSANGQRRVEDPMTRAWKMQRAADYGHDPESIAQQWRCSASTVKNSLALLELHPKVQAAIQAQRVGPIAALRALGELPKAAQVEKLPELEAEYNGADPEPGANGAANGKAPRRKNAGPKMRSRKFLTKMRDYMDDDSVHDDRALLEFLLGDDKAYGRMLSHYKDAAREAGWRKDPKA